MNKKKLPNLLLFILVIFVSNSLWSIPMDKEIEFPFSLCFVPEMEYIPEVDDWPICTTEAFAKESEKIMESWKKHHSWVYRQLSPGHVKALSRWAQKQMKTYNQLPNFASMTFSAARCKKDQTKLVFDGTADTLPTHSKLVTRWLKIFIMYDLSTQSIIRVTATIRGQLLE